MDDTAQTEVDESLVLLGQAVAEYERYFELYRLAEVTNRELGEPIPPPPHDTPLTFVIHTAD